MTLLKKDDSERELERRSYRASDYVVIGEGEIHLRRVSLDGRRHVVEVAMPWQQLYRLSEHRTQVGAQTEFERVDNMLRNGDGRYKICLTGPHNAELVDVMQRREEE